MERIIKSASFKSFFGSLFSNNNEKPIENIDEISNIDEETRKELRDSTRRIESYEKAHNRSYDEKRINSNVKNTNRKVQNIIDRKDIENEKTRKPQGREIGD